jgi:hypothetical protein
MIEGGTAAGIRRLVGVRDYGSWLMAIALILSFSPTPASNVTFQLFSHAPSVYHTHVLLRHVASWPAVLFVSWKVFEVFEVDSRFPKLRNIVQLCV